MLTADAIIIGAGVTGTSTAFSLARRGVTNVRVLERQNVASGATGKSSGLVRMHYTNPVETQLAFRSFQWFKHWEEIVGGHCGFVQTGVLRLATSDQMANLQANVRMQQEIGVNTRIVSRDEINDIQPGLWLDDIEAAAYEPESGYADPSSTASSFIAAARDRGVTLHRNTQAIKILTAGGRVTGVKTNQGHFAAGTVLIAANAWSRPLLQSIGQDLPITPLRSEVAVAERPPALAKGHVTIQDGPMRLYFRTEGTKLTLIGTGFREPTDPDNYADSASPAHLEDVAQRLTKRFPAMHEAGMRRSHAGVIDLMPDDLPVIDRVPGIEGLFIAAGFSGHGFKISPAVGSVLAELMTTGASLALDLGLLRFSRFAEGKYSLSPTDYQDVLAAYAQQR